MSSVRLTSSMKLSSYHFRWSRLVVLLVSSVLTQLTPAYAADDVPILPTPVKAERGEFDGTGELHLMGNVQINVPGFLRLECDDFVGEIPETAAAATNVNLTVTGNVRIYITARRGTNPPVELVATGGRGVYTGTNQLFVLTESPKIVNEEGTLYGDRIEYNLGNDQMKAMPFRFILDPRSMSNLFKLKRPGKPATLP